jgi:hypothetical protein
MKTTSYYACCNVHGLISTRLQARTVDEARQELADATSCQGSPTAREWIDARNQDLERDIGFVGEGEPFAQALERILALGACIVARQGPHCAEWLILVYAKHLIEDNAPIQLSEATGSAATIGVAPPVAPTIALDNDTPFDGDVARSDK